MSTGQWSIVAIALIILFIEWYAAQKGINDTVRNFFQTMFSGVPHD